MRRPTLPPDSTVSLTLHGIPADLYLRLLVEAGQAGRGLRAEVLHRLSLTRVALPDRPRGRIAEADLGSFGGAVQ